ncbi:hypothetical protein [Streptomyces sp. NPDC101115]|uniref:hypothetical protein n=1 Tax=Streptomyces sp. NPDC101115 TaxID=3366106 RepID=UPI0038069C62
MTQPSPADTLRAAAHHIEQQLLHIPDGPWRSDGDNGVHCHDGQAASAHLSPYPTSVYIAAMGPVTGRAIARWLGSWTGMSLDEAAAMPEDLRHALAVARAILGEDQP